MPFPYASSLFGPTNQTTSTSIGNYTNATTTKIWTNWIQGTQTMRTDQIWTQWATATSLDYRDGGNWDYQQVVPDNQYVPPHIQTAAEIAEAEALAERYRQQASKEKRLREEAEAKAEALLLRHLTPEQAHDYRRNRAFTVCSRRGSRYRISCDRISGNIVLLDSKGERVQRYCAHAPHDSMVGADHFLAQALNLRFNEDEFLLVANRH